MNSNKNFEAYAKSLFGEDFGEKKGEKKGSAPWSSNAAEEHPRPSDIKVDSNDKKKTSEKRGRKEKTKQTGNENKISNVENEQPLPFDVIVVDSKDKKKHSEKKERKEKAKHTGIGNKISKKSKKSVKEDKPLTPVLIDLIESPFSEEKEKSDSLFRKRRKSDTKAIKKKADTKPKSEYDFDIDFGEHDNDITESSKKRNDCKKSGIRLERRGSERDSGIGLNDDGEESDAIHLDIFSENQHDSESDSDLAYFCVDHMKMCRSRSDFRKHKGCTRSHKSIEPQNPIEPKQDSEAKRSSSAFSIGSRRFGRGGRQSAAAVMGMQTMCKDSLEKLYNYAGVMIEDRENLKAELKNKKALMEERMLDFMEDIISHILALKNKCLGGLEDRNKENLLHITQQILRAEKIRQETYAIWQSLQVPDDYSSFEEYKGIIVQSVERTRVLEEILESLYDSCQRFTYEMKPDTEPAVLYHVDAVASVQEIPAIPTLPPFLTMKSENDVEDDESTSPSFRSLERIENVGGKHESGNEKCCFTGCAYILEDSVLLADWASGVIKLLNKLGLVADTLTFGQSPWDVIQNCSGQAAVTVPNLQTVFFVEADPHLHIVDSFKTGGDCFGICKIGTNYAVTCDPWSKSPSVRVYDKLGNNLLRVQVDSIGENYFKCPLHICSDYFNTVLYVSDASADCVYAISLSGDIIFAYAHGDIEYPTGLATDRNNCLFVCGRASSNVHKLNNDGSLQEKLVNRLHGVSSPCAIAFHPNGDHMILTDLEGEMSAGYWKLKF